MGVRISFAAVLLTLCLPESLGFVYSLKVQRKVGVPIFFENNECANTSRVQEAKNNSSCSDAAGPMLSRSAFFTTIAAVVLAPSVADAKENQVSSAREESISGLLPVQH